MEPERPIEKLLRAVAKKRRDQAGDPVELHPVARQELLREVSRRSDQTAGRGLFSNFFSAIRPRLALAAGFLALLVIAGWLAVPLLTGNNKTSVSSTLGAAHSDLAFTKKSAPVTAPAPATPAPATPQANPSSDVFTVQLTPPNENAANRKLALAGSESSKQINVNEGSVTQENSPGANTAASAQTVISPPAVTQSAGEMAAKNPPSAAPAGTFAAAPPVESPPMAGANRQAIAGTALSSTATPLVTNSIAPAVTIAAAESQAEKNVNAQNTPAAFHANDLLDTANKDAIARIAPASQRFYRVPVASATRQRGFGGGGAGGIGGSAPVLASFQVEQSGPQIRIVDSDGSVYTGHWQTMPFDKTPTAEASAAFAAPGAASLPDRAVAVPALKARPQVPPVQTYFFLVTGTNRNLKQNIVFSGSFIPLSHGLSGAISGNTETRRAAPGTGTSLVLTNSRIAGKVVIGNKKEIELDATPAR